MKWLDQFPLWMILVIALSLGLAPFSPEPHVWEKLKMLTRGELTNPVDIFDFVMHGAPWALLVLKIVRGFRTPT